MRIGLRREDKSPLECRVPLVPDDVQRLVRDESIEVCVQSSAQRAFSDEQFRLAGAHVAEDLGDCPVVFGVKELSLDAIEAARAYVFFAHVIKGQPYNMPMLGRMIERGCTLIDYERITDDAGRRLIFFGRYAGLAGMIDTLWTFGRRASARGVETPFSRVRQATTFGCVEEAKGVVAEVGAQIRTLGLPPELPPLVCGFAGYGNTSRGAQEIYDLLPVETVAPADLERLPTDPGGPSRKVYKVVFEEEHMVEPTGPGRAFDLRDYYEHPDRYRSRFAQFLPYLSILVNCIYWEPKYPPLVTKDDLKRLYDGETSPRLEVIGDITCDVGGPLACTVRATDPANPVYVYDPHQNTTIDGVFGGGPAVLAVDILPTELPIDSSEEFSRVLTPYIPAIARADFSKPFEACMLPPEIKRAVVVYRGNLTQDYRYLQEHLAKADVVSG